MKLGFCAQNFSNKPLSEIIPMVAKKGYEAIEIPLTTAMCSVTCRKH